MNQQPDQLSKLLLEADGLLLLLHRHRDDTPIDAIKLLRKKLELILALTEGLDEEESSVDSETLPASSNEDQVADCQPETEPTPQPQPDYSDEIEPIAEVKSENVGEYIEDTIEDPEPEHGPELEHKPEPEPEQDSEASTPEFVEEPAQPVFIDTRNEPTVFFGDEPLPPIDEPDKPSELDEVPLPMPETPVYHRTYIINESTEPTEPITPRRPVSSVFNLNDKFRFRRELFGNSDAQYVECLDTLSVMSSIDEAREYLFDDLKWDPENEDVKAFIELLTNYYR